MDGDKGTSPSSNPYSNPNPDLPIIGGPKDKEPATQPQQKEAKIPNIKHDNNDK